MNLESTDQHPVLQVFLSDTPVAPEPNANFHLSAQGPIVHFQEYIFGDSTIKCHSLYGKNITACYSACFMEDEKEIYTIPAQPIVAFHIQVSGDCLARFGKGQEESRYTKGQSLLFWQNDHTLEYVLPPTESDYFDLYIRPGHLLDMADRYPVLRQFAMAVATSSPNVMEFFVSRIDQQLLDSIDEMLLEVKNFQVNEQRFTHLCECLLLQCLDIPISVEPPPTDSVKRSFDSAFAHLEDDVFSEEQNSHLWSIARYYNRNQLIDKFYEVKQEYLRSQAAACQG
ncbi:hypothetical protein D3C80_687360 [compost metagenome]